MPVYAREGVRRAWQLDPGERTLEVYARGGERRVAGSSGVSRGGGGAAGAV